MVLGSAFFDILPATLLLIGFAIAGGIVILVIRKKLKSNKRTSTTFTLNELRQFRDEGTLSEEEYERAKQSIIEQSL
jgi:hypothetical protein